MLTQQLEEANEALDAGAAAQAALEQDLKEVHLNLKQITEQLVTLQCTTSSHMQHEAGYRQSKSVKAL